MNEAETRAEYIDPKLTAAGWGVVEGSRVLREYHINDGKIQAGGRAKQLPTTSLFIRTEKLLLSRQKVRNWK